MKNVRLETKAVTATSQPYLLCWQYFPCRLNAKRPRNCSPYKEKVSSNIHKLLFSGTDIENGCEAIKFHAVQVQVIGFCLGGAV
jgi:hypothetical protein